MKVDSASYVLPITNNITINIQSGNVTINQDAALLAGVEVNIAEGAGLTVADGKNIYFYDSDEWNSDNFVWGPCKFKSVAYAPGKAYNRSNNDLVDAKMDVNGSVTAIGAIYTTKGGADICSSNKTGKYVQQGEPGAETKTYQYKTNSNEEVIIPITAAKLHNADGSYTETSTAEAGKTFTYCACTECNGKWEQNVAVICNSNGEQTGEPYQSLQAAVKAPLEAGQYIKLLHNTTEKIDAKNNLYLDLNGYTLTGDIKLAEGFTLYGMDSTTNKYGDTNAGKIVGSVTPYAKTTYQTPPVTPVDPNDDYTYKRYVAIPGKEADNITANLSFHRFNISVTGYRFELAAPKCALFFIGKFQGDKAAKDYLTSLGFTLKDNIDSTTKNFSCAKSDFFSKGAQGENSTVDISTDGAYLFEAYLMRDIDKEKPATYQTPFTATAKATFGSSGVPEDNSLSSEEQRLSFQQALWDALSAPDMEEKDGKILMNFLNDMNIPNPNP